MTRSRTLALVATLGLLAAALVVAPALAGKAETEIGATHAEIKNGVAKYSGKVKSPRNNCRKGRKVTVIHNTDPPYTIGVTKTDEHGNWKLTGPYPPDSSDDNIIIRVASNKNCKGAKVTGAFYEI